jgi:hypothetical protein
VHSHQPATAARTPCSHQQASWQGGHDKERARLIAIEQNRRPSTQLPATAALPHRKEHARGRHPGASSQVSPAAMHGTFKRHCLLDSQRDRQQGARHGLPGGLGAPFCKHGAGNRALGTPDAV